MSTERHTWRATRAPGAGVHQSRNDLVVNAGGASSRGPRRSPGRSGRGGSGSDLGWEPTPCRRARAPACPSPCSRRCSCREGGTVPAAPGTPRGRCGTSARDRRRRPHGLVGRGWAWRTVRARCRPCRPPRASSRSPRASPRRYLCGAAQGTARRRRSDAPLVDPVRRRYGARGTPDPSRAGRGFRRQAEGVMTGELLTVDVVTSDGVQVVALRGELDVASAGRVEHTLRSLDAPLVVVDVARLTFIDSSGLTVIVQAHNAATRSRRRFEVRGATGAVRRVFEITGLTRLLSDGSEIRPRRR